MSQVEVQDVFKVFLKSAKSLSIFASQQSNVQHNIPAELSLFKRWKTLLSCLIASFLCLPKTAIPTFPFFTHGLAHTGCNYRLVDFSQNYARYVATNFLSSDPCVFVGGSKFAIGITFFKRPFEP